MRIILLSIYIFLSIQLSAQVPVSKEPRHHPVYESDKFRILDVLLPPGDTTQYHLHSTPSVFIFFTKTRTGSQNIDKPPTEGTSVTGNAQFENLSPPHTRVHRVWNTDSATFHVMDIELLSKDSGFSNAPFNNPHVRLSSDTGWARIYSVKLNTGETLSIDKVKSYFILVAIKDGIFLLTENGMTSRTSVAAGNFFLVKPGDSLDLINQNSPDTNFALVEIP